METLKGKQQTRAVALGSRCGRVTLSCVARSSTYSQPPGLRLSPNTRSLMLSSVPHRLLRASGKRELVFKSLQGHPRRFWELKKVIKFTTGCHTSGPFLRREPQRMWACTIASPLGVWQLWSLCSPGSRSALGQQRHLVAEMRTSQHICSPAAGGSEMGTDWRHLRPQSARSSCMRS